MRKESFAPLLVDHLLFFGQILLFLEHPKERFFLSGYLVLKIVFSLFELNFSSNFHFSQQSSSLFILKHFSLSSVSLAFFECSLGSKSVNISLSISGFLLQFTELLDFSFLLFTHHSCFFLSFILSLLLLEVVLVNILIFLFFFSSGFIFDNLG